MKNNLNNTDAYSFLSNEYDFYPEDYFQKMLILERKRTERSGKRFLLMLIDIHRLFKKKRINGSVKKLVGLLEGSTREIDIKGWYMENRVIGIIYTEINGANKESIMKKIRNKINDTLDPERAALITMSCFFFPENNDKKGNNNFERNMTLYKDLSMRKVTRKVSVTLKRIIDITGSFAGVLIFSPLFLAIAVLIKLSSKGPVFFRQKRIGYGGKEFTLLKFRSMYVNNDDTAHKEFTKNFISGSAEGSFEANDGIYKIKRDPRITGIGEFLRKTSLDEIPQLFNVFMGDMSLVGPRPAIRYEVKEYDTWHKRRVLEVKPGITGVWQVKGRSKTTFDEMVRMDIQYIKRWSILFDFMLILRTPLAVFRTEGAY